MSEMKNTTLEPEFVRLISRIPDEYIPLFQAVGDGLAEGRISGDAVDAATERMHAGEDKQAVMRELIEASNRRIYAAVVDCKAHH